MRASKQGSSLPAFFKPRTSPELWKEDEALPTAKTAGIEKSP